MVLLDKFHCIFIHLSKSNAIKHQALIDGEISEMVEHYMYNLVKHFKLHVLLPEN